MKGLVVIIGGAILAVLAVYILWAAFIPMLVGQKVVERQVTKNSPQYIITQRTALVTLYKGYTEATDSATKEAVLGQMCQIAVELPKWEIPSHLQGTLGLCLR
jgi:hypothetical protein